MISMLVTCPESAHLEQIDTELTPVGMLIRDCTAWAGAPCPATCPRTCAARLDRRRASGDRRINGTMLVRSCALRR